MPIILTFRVGHSPSLPKPMPSYARTVVSNLPMGLESLHLRWRMATLPDVRGQYKFEQTIRNGKTYKQAYGWLGMPKQVQEHRSTKNQRKVAGGTGDDAGHLIGNRFGSPGGESNLSLQNWKSNRYGTYHWLEDDWAAKRQRGVDIWVHVTDVFRPGELRPFMRNVQWLEKENGKETKYEVDFANTHTPESRDKQQIKPTNLGTMDAEIINVDFRKRQRID